MKAFESIDVFIDREIEMSRLMQLVSFSVDQKDKPLDYQRVMHIVGKSKAGKSFLLNKFGYELSQREAFFPLYITFVEYIDFAGDKFALKVLQFIDGIISTALKVKPQLNESSPVSAYSEWVLRGVEQVQREKSFIFLLDEVNMLSVNQINMLEDYLLAKMLTLKNVVVVLAGRHLVTGWKDFALRPYIEGEKENVVELSGFEFEYSQKQIQAINPQITDFIPEIHEVSGGSPGNNKKIVEQLGDPPLFNELNAIHACNQEFYEALASASDGLPESISSELLPALEALCVLEDFDKEYEMPVMLSAHPALNGDWTEQRCTDLLNILSKLQIGPGKLVDYDMEKSALAMEEQTRFNLEKELKIRDKALWKMLHCTAMKMYSEWAEQYGSVSIFASKVVYHKDQLEKAGFNPSECNIM